MLICISRPPSKEIKFYQAEITNYQEENSFLGEKNGHHPKAGNSKI
jgi:hypothetical protein